MKGPNHLARALGNASPADIDKAIDELNLTPHQRKWLEHDVLWATYMRLSALHERACAAYTLHLFGPNPVTKTSEVVCLGFPACPVCKRLQKASRAASNAMTRAWETYYERDLIWHPREAAEVVDELNAIDKKAWENNDASR